MALVSCKAPIKQLLGSSRLPQWLERPELLEIKRKSSDNHSTYSTHSTNSVSSLEVLECVCSGQRNSPSKLRTKLAKSLNAQDHLSNAYVATARYCKRSKGDKNEFIVFQLVDNSNRSSTRMLVLDQHNDLDAESVTRWTNWTQNARSWGSSIVNHNFLQSSPRLSSSMITFHVFPQIDPKLHVEHSERDELVFSDSTTLPLEYLIVLASRISSPGYGKNIQITASKIFANNWFSRSLWNAIRIISFHQKNIPVDLSREPVLIADLFTKFGVDLRAFRDEITRSQLKKHSVKERQEVLKAAHEARQQHIRAELEQANTIAQRKALLNKEEQELHERYQALVRELSIAQEHDFSCSDGGPLNPQVDAADVRLLDHNLHQSSFMTT